MSLALLVDVGGVEDGESRLTAAVGVSMTAALLLATLEQFLETPDGRWWLPLACALACAGCCFLSWRRSCGRPPMRLQASPDGQLRLSSLRTGECVDAAFVRGWCLGRLVWLHLRPLTKVDPAAPVGNGRQSASIFEGWDCRLLLARRSFEETSWHALRRWLVWQSRSRRGRAIVA
jgi:hypothetical protein